jgi:hypothetical protein
MIMRWVLRSSAAAAVFVTFTVDAQQAQQQQSEWAQLPRMQLERQFAGPLQDTIVQRWRDPVDGSVCYIYLPITAQHTPPTPAGYVQYGANTIGTISCFASAAPVNTPLSRRNGHPPDTEEPQARSNSKLRRS